MRLGNYFIFRPSSPRPNTHSAAHSPFLCIECRGYVVMHGIQRLIGIFGVLFYFGLNCQWVAHAHAPQPQPPERRRCTTVKGVTESPRWWHPLQGGGGYKLSVERWLIDWLIDWLIGGESCLVVGNNQLRCFGVEARVQSGLLVN